jgi:hypothetical protein
MTKEEQEFEVTKEEQEFERWFAEGVAFGFNPDDTVSLVPPPGAAEMVAQWLAREESTK